MDYYFLVIFFSVVLVIIEDRSYGVIGFLSPLSSRRNYFTHHYSNISVRDLTRLISASSSNSATIYGNYSLRSRSDISDESAPGEKIDHVYFGGKKWTTTDDDNETTEKVPCVPTLDIHSGPLPTRAYVVEGRQEFDAKSTCRIAIAVKLNLVGRDTINDPDEVVRRLQACVDAGFDTFQLHDQGISSLNIVRRMNENTPSYVNTHWSVSMKAPSASTNSNLSPTLEIRQSVLDLVKQTQGDALDSLQVDCSKFKVPAPYDSTLEMIDYLIDLQREGWIRSIGIKGVGLPKLQQDIMTHFGSNIDFQQQEGNLLLPPFSSDFSSPTYRSFRIDNSLASGLLTDIYSNKCRHSKNNLRNSHPSLTNDNKLILNKWASQYQGRHTVSSLTSLSVWQLYQEQIVERLSWIALKHDVSMSAVALRWVLECSDVNTRNDTKDGPIVSSAVADVNFDSKYVYQNPVEFRQVFRFQLDEEDKDMLSRCASYGDDNSRKENKYSEIDLNNNALWL